MLLQNQQEKWRPVTFASRTLSETETCYAQIERGALALTWALESLPSMFLEQMY